MQHFPSFQNYPDLHPSRWIRSGQTKPLRVLILLIDAEGRGAQRGVNGPEVLTLDTLRMLDKSLVESLVAYSSEGSLLDGIQGSGRWCDFPIKAARPIKILSQLSRILSLNNLDLLHCHGPMPLDFLTVVMARRFKVKCIITRHSMISHLRIPPLARALVRFLDRYTLRQADRVVAVSENGREVLLAEGCPSNKLVRIYNGVDVDRFRPGMTPRLDILHWRGQSFTVGMFAQMRTIKRQDVLLHALARAVAEGRDWRVLLAGKGPKLLHHQRLTRELGIEDRVKFLGFVRDTPPVYAACHAVALTSDREGFPLTLLEAMASGLPVVASNVAGVSELIGEAGLILPENSADHLYHKLKELEDADLRLRLGLAGRHRVMQEFEIKKTIAGLQDLYLSCCAEPGN